MERPVLIVGGGGVEFPCACARNQGACDALTTRWEPSSSHSRSWRSRPRRPTRSVLIPQARLWVDPDSSTAHVGTADAKRLAAIPSATWLTGGDPYGDARRMTRAAAGAVRVIVATRRAAASASGPPRRRTRRDSTPSCGSTPRASPTASAARARPPVSGPRQAADL